MRSMRLLSHLRSQRGQIIVFTMIALVFLLVVAGSLASDVAKIFSQKNEIQRSLDAAALAAPVQSRSTATMPTTSPPSTRRTSLLDRPVMFCSGYGIPPSRMVSASGSASNRRWMARS